MKTTTLAKTAALLVITAALLAGCGSKLKEENPPQPNNQQGSEPAAPDQGSGSTVQPADADPVAVRTFLSSNDIKNGDIYLQGGKLHINIVGLTPEIEQQVAEQFTAGSYELHDVKYTIQELEQAQHTLMDQGLLTEYGISSSIDVIENELDITIPEEKKAGISKIEQAVGRELVNIQIDVMQEPHIVGVIVSIDPSGKQLLIQEDGSAEPNFTMAVQEDSQLVTADGKQAGISAFAAGDRVQIWHTGAINESFPAQGSIRRMALAADQP